MQKSTFLRLCAVFFLAIASLHVNAITINGINYKQYSGSGTVCPGGSKVFVYKHVKYCKAYRAAINWTIPTKRTNGTPLRISEIKGYEVYWTRTSDKARGVIKVSSNTQSSTYFDAYTPSTYYFAMSAIDSRGLKSPLSSMVQAKLGK